MRVRVDNALKDDKGEAGHKTRAGSGLARMTTAEISRLLKLLGYNVPETSVKSWGRQAKKQAQCWQIY